MSDNSPVSHEGNPKQDSITIGSGDVLSTATLGVVLPFVPATPPPEVPAPVNGGGGGCPGCQPFIFSSRDQAAIDQCASTEGDGCVVTCPGDYDFDPTFYGAACENHYGDFRFGLNADEDDITAPVYYTTSPSLWQPAKGFVIVNSSCSGRITRRIQFDYHASASSVHVDYTNITPDIFQTDVIDNWNTTGAHGQISPAPDPDGTPLSGVSVGGIFDCRFKIFTSGSEYYSVVQATYEGENNTGIAGIAFLTDDGSNPKITGYGLLIDRVHGLLLTVQWIDAISSVLTILDSRAYTPLPGDVLQMRAAQACPCPYGNPDSSTVWPAYPKGGYILSNSPAGTFTSTRPTFANQAGSLAPVDWAALRYGALIALQVDNDSCDNQIIFRSVLTKFVSSSAACSS